MMFKIPTISRPIRHLRRYRHILTVFTRHGFGFALSQLPTEPLWLRDLYPFPIQEPASLPAHFRQALEELGPAFVKLGQMLSTRPDVLPPSYISELAKLQDNVPPVPWNEIREVIQAELGAPPEEVFGEINPKPLAAASLAQVHAAKLLTRQKVVIKVQRPHILPTIQTDLEIIHDIANYAEQHTPLGRVYNLVEIVEDFAETLHNELNYQSEARNADRIRANFAQEHCLHIPAVYWEYTTRRVLVMEYIEGIKITDIAALDAAGYDRQKIANNAARMIVKEILEDGFFHADPHPGNLIVMANEVIGAMDFGMVGYLSDADRTNLIRLYSMAVQMDAKSVTDGLIHIGAAPIDVDRRALSQDIERLLRYYNGLALKDVHVDELMNSLMPLAFEYRLHLPTNFWQLGKTLAMMEGIGYKLAPDFDIFAFSGPYVAQLMLKAAMPSRHWLNEITRRGLAWSDLLEELPHIGMLLLDRIEKRAPLKLSLDHSNLELLDRMVTRIALSVIVAAMILGLAVLIPATTDTPWIVQAIVILSFVVALVMGGGILVSIVRKK
ncbi:MAG TPA: lipopolysaccharide core heptose(II) kinase RfaY [Anaerolineae bacterium]|mgnify:CR=1 FL=1|nr:lipopolysaccharide core heptose(II) kinase RfaY [Anaerolineae bacterium]HQI87342.1 lipopolysaccharide core heptose(II) kinase RfaY [Anaerolineae bacterium]